MFKKLFNQNKNMALELFWLVGQRQSPALFFKLV